MSHHIHDLVAKGYNSERGIIADKNRVVLDRLAERWLDRTSPLKVIDLGVGDGALLEMLTALPFRFDFTGVDVSQAMLDLAARRVRLAPIRASAAEASRHAPHGAFDLVLAHFILAYVDSRALLAEARRLLAPGGVFSLVTTTNHGGQPMLEQIDRNFRHSLNPLRRMVARAVDRSMARSSVPDAVEDLFPLIAEAGLKVADRHTLSFPIRFDSADDAFRMGIEEGWTANVLHAPPLPPRLVGEMVRLGLRMFEYPYICDQIVEILELTPA